MKQTVYKDDFTNAFKEMGRGENFSYKGLVALYEYFEELEQDSDIEIELDVIAICTEYSEYTSLEEFNQAYGKECETVEEIADYTQLIVIEGENFIISDF